MRKVELLAPAGNMEALIAAVQGGCDAVYLGLSNYSARAFAGNFTHEEYLEAIQYCHLRNVKIYVTLNTVLFETEIENIKREVDFLYENDVDGILVQDLGLFHYIQTIYPDLDLHCSTQMHIHNVAGVKFMQDHGAKRIVLARETPIEIVREACQTGAEIETFIYGASCISYSGQCYMSAFTKHRSANKGMCAQCCRLKYYSKNGRLDEGDYLLSPKDLNEIHQIPTLIEAGISSFKIEGRMKRKEYVYLVVKTFREAIDAYYAGQSYKISNERMQALKLLFNRGFSEGHLFHDDITKRMSHERPNHMGIPLGKVLNYRNDWVTIELDEDLYQNDGLRILNEPEDTGLTAVKIEKDGKLVRQARKGDVVKLQCKQKPSPKKGQPVFKTTDAKLMKEIDGMIDENHRKYPITISYYGYPDTPFMVTISDGTNEVSVQSEMECAIAKNAPLSKERIEEALSKLGDAPYFVSAFEGDVDNIFLPIKEINEVRRLALEAFNQKRAIYHERAGKQADFELLKEPDLCKYRLIVEGGKDEGEIGYLYLEPGKNLQTNINEDDCDTKQFEHAVLNQIGDLYSQKIDCIAGMHFNITNSYGLAFLLGLEGMRGVVFSYECDDDNILRSLEAFRLRYGFVPCTFKFTYGKRPLMFIKQGFSNELKDDAFYDLHGQKYDLDYNSKVVSILEDAPYQTDNPYCWGSYIRLSNTKQDEKMKEKAYEEIHGRI